MTDYETQRRLIWLNRMQKEMAIKREKATAPVLRTSWNLWLLAMGVRT